MALLIESVSLSGWKSHSKSSLSFSQGTNVLLGIMGSGKSSVVSAIVFALFGETPDLRAKRSKLDDLLRKGANSAEVVLFFSAGGKKYSVKRSIERGVGSKAELRDSEGILIEGPLPAKVTRAIENFLGIDYPLFIQAIYLEQNEIDAFLWEGKGKRREILDGFFGIANVEEARTSLLSISSSLKSELETLSKENPSEDACEKKAELERQEATLSKAKSDLLRAETELANLSSQILKLEKKLAESQKAREEAFRLSEKSRVLFSRAEELRAKLSRFGGKAGTPESQRELEILERERKELFGVFRELDSLDARIRALYERKLAIEKKASSNEISQAPLESEARISLETCQAEHAKSLAELSRARREISEAKVSLERLSEISSKIRKGAREELSKIEGEIAGFSAELTEVSRRLSETTSALGALESNRGENCPVCGSALEHSRHRSLLQEKKAERDGFFSRSAELEAKLAKLKQELPFARRAVEETEKLVLEEASLSEKARLGKEAEKNLSILEEIEKTSFAEKRKAEQDLENSRERARLDAEALAISEEEKSLAERKKSLLSKARGATLESIDLKIAEKRDLAEAYLLSSELAKSVEEGRIAHLKASELLSEENEKEHEKTRSDLSECTRLAGVCQGETARLPIQIREISSRIISIGSELSKAEEKELRLSRVSAGLAFSRKLDSLLRETEQILRNETISEINSSLANFWRLLYPYKNYSGARLLTDENDYVLQLCDTAGGWLDAERIASGGEKSLACLALRIAFSKTLAPGAGLLILDEPTHNLDSNAIALMTGVFREKISEISMQTILITHDEALEASATGNCYRLEREGSEETSISALSEN